MDKEKIDEKIGRENTITDPSCGNLISQPTTFFISITYAPTMKEKPWLHKIKSYRTLLDKNNIYVEVIII